MLNFETVLGENHWKVNAKMTEIRPGLTLRRVSLVSLG
jgi:hypothetical protein